MADEGKFSAFIFGFGVGLAVGVLFAPRSGEETRDLLRTKAGEGADYVKRRGGELKESASDLVDRGKTAISRQRENLAAAVEAGKQAYREAVSAGPEGEAGTAT